MHICDMFQDYADGCIPVILKGTVSRNLHTVLNSVSCLQSAMGRELTASTLPEHHVEEMVNNLLHVVVTSKVSVCCCCDVWSDVWTL